LKLDGTCEDDFQKAEERCASKRGVLEKGSACKCRDGSIVDNDEKSICAEPWFFYKSQSTANVSTDTTTITDTSKKNEGKNDDAEKDENAEEDNKNDASTTATGKDDTKKEGATCTCQHYLNNCVIYKPGDKNAIKWIKTTADKCTRNLCYKNFSDIIFETKNAEDGKGGCDGSWDYKATIQQAGAEKKEEAAAVDINKYCVCKKLRNTNPVGCGLFLPGSEQPTTYANNIGSCTPENCVQIFGNSYTIKTHCYDASTRKFLWHHQD
jgi:hypothetical protein